MDNLRGLVEDGDCDVILIVSNGSILKNARLCSGLTTNARLKYLKWPHVSDEDMKQYLFENRDKIFLHSTDVNIEQIEKFVSLFDGSFTDIISVQEISDLESYTKNRLITRRNEL
jgi:hypothetical protein